MRYYKEHNLTPEHIPMPPHTDTIKVNKMLHFEQIAHYTGASIEELRTHNPQYLHDIIPGTEKEYILQLPYQFTGAFIDHEDEIYAYKDSVYFSPAALRDWPSTPRATDLPPHPHQAAGKSTQAYPTAT